MSMREALNGHRNSLGIIRLVLASAVIFDHAFPLGGWGTAPFMALTRDQQSLGGVAVLGFFAISGYLVTKSGLTNDALQFIWRRFLRIYPGFWVVLLFGSLIVGPSVYLVEGRGLGDYFSMDAGGPLTYLTANATLQIGQYGINDVFAGNPFGGPINGSIWTLVYEWLCYLVVAGLVLFGVLAKAKMTVPIMTGFLAVFQLLNIVLPGALAAMVPLLGDPWRVNFAFVFFIGACIALYSDRVPYSVPLGVFAILFSLATLRVGGFNTMGFIAFAYAVLFLAAWLPARLHRFGAVNDYSYGVYLYGWVVQQYLAYLGVNEWGYVPYVLLSLVGAFALAWSSWHVVEKQAMKLKDRGPGRGLAYWEEKGRRRMGRISSPGSASETGSPPQRAPSEDVPPVPERGDGPEPA
jgi:peptidoglycan/LPS O-acetylase OafA/YrhL